MVHRGRIESPQPRNGPGWTSILSIHPLTYIVASHRTEYARRSPCVLHSSFSCWCAIAHRDTMFQSSVREATGKGFGIWWEYLPPLASIVSSNALSNPRFSTYLVHWPVTATLYPLLSTFIRPSDMIPNHVSSGPGRTLIRRCTSPSPKSMEVHIQANQKKSRKGYYTIKI
ncbi:hypothetical protein BGZ61DRAFT_438394, partial [Ilyonectria robusta]|uniref:uncharacterized protein n=1 Tax=Ilyonectria robusta TaxID=1079257 RepID=UPI001E8EEA21